MTAVRPGDYEEFDLLVAMDDENANTLRTECPDEHEGKIRLMRSWDPEGPGDVPDPYYGGPRGFDLIYEIIDRSCRALLDEARPDYDRALWALLSWETWARLFIGGNVFAEEPRA